MGLSSTGGAQGGVHKEAGELPPGESTLIGEAMVYSIRKAASSVVQLQNVREVELESSLATDARQIMPQLLFYIIAILARARTESPKSAQLLF